MKRIRSTIFRVLVAAAVAGIAGCTCCSRVPVSLEPLNDWFLYHGPACRHYPYSCPPCPYACGEATVQEDVAPEQSDTAAPSQRPAN